MKKLMIAFVLSVVSFTTVSAFADDATSNQTQQTQNASQNSNTGPLQWWPN